MRSLPKILGVAVILGLGAGCAPSTPPSAGSSAASSSEASTPLPTSSAAPSNEPPPAPPTSSTPVQTHPSQPASTPTPEPSLPAGVPPLSDAQLAAGLVDVRTIIPDAVVDLRYATADNFTGVQLYPSDARCLVHDSVTVALQTAAQLLRDSGLLLVFWDCYRPHEAQVLMWEVVSDPSWVASPRPYATSHESARSVDVTLAWANAGDCEAASTQGYCALDMGTAFDEFTPRAHADATEGLSQQQIDNRWLLRSALEAGGLTIYSGEWWHFDTQDAKEAIPHLNVPVN